ncbi:MAG: CAP domain-containing protein [bacterium]|nr:CAP domain-containing protein [bacterium]
MSRKKTGILIGAGAAVCVGAALFILFGIHRHEWTAATCTEPEICPECGKTRGEALGHVWEEATCTLAAACSVCGETKGEALGHTWEEATCTLAAACSVCGETKGEALGHTWKAANYQDASVCSICGETEGEPLAGGYEENRILCVSGENEPYAYVTSTSYTLEEKTAATVIMSGYRTFDSDETHPALKNYEWVTARFELLFWDQNARRYGGSPGWALSDYFTPELCEESAGTLKEEVNATEELDVAAQYTVNYHGVDYDQCIALFTAPRQSNLYAVHSMAFECYLRVPKGYDGTVVVFYDPALTAEEDTEESVLTEDLNQMENAAVHIRLKKDGSDSDFPGMTVLSGILPVQPGELLKASSVIRNDGNYKSGFYGLQKTATFDDYDKDTVWNREPSYEVTTLTAETKLLSQIEMPEEEGIYEITAAAAGEDGNAVISRITVLVDGTAPTIHVPKEKITVRPGDVFFVLKDVYGTDNLCPNEDCMIEIDPDELQKLADAMQSAKAGTYNLTYYATDLAGNVGTKTVRLTISGKSGGQQSSQNSGQQTQAAVENQFMESMAKDAFDIVNQYRADANLPALTWNDSVYEGTKIRARELVSLFSHTRPNGESCFTVLSGFTACGENIASGQRSANRVCEAWYNSEGHRNNMLNGNFTQGAVACWYENGTYYWVNLFTD